MKRVGFFEAKTHFSALIQDAKKRETIIVTKNGQAVAQISPVASDKSASAAEAMKRIFSSKARLGKNSIGDLINEGRRC